MRVNPFKSFWRFLLISAISYLILFLFFAAYQYFTLPEVSRWEKENPKITSFMEYRIRHDKSPETKDNLRYWWIPYSRIPDLMRKAVIVSEDASFWVHEGIDWHEVKASLKRNIEEGNFVRGGSTITQQVAKNLYLTPGKNISRKLTEWLIAKELEKELKKSRILELYLNIVEWGQNIYGINAASRIYFSKAPAELTLNQIVRLAAVLPNPLELHPNRMTRGVYWRSNVILRRLYRFDFIDEYQYKHNKAKFDTLLYHIQPTIKTAPDTVIFKKDLKVSGAIQKEVFSGEPDSIELPDSVR